MDDTEARALLLAELTTWRTKSWAELSGLVGESRHFDRVGPSAAEYQLEIEVLWDGEPGRDIRVMGSIDDRGWRAFAPLTESFILASTGEFVGEG